MTMMTYFDEYDPYYLKIIISSLCVVIRLTSHHLRLALTLSYTVAVVSRVGKLNCKIATIGAFTVTFQRFKRKIL